MTDPVIDFETQVRSLIGMYLNFVSYKEDISTENVSSFLSKEEFYKLVICCWLKFTVCATVP